MLGRVAFPTLPFKVQLACTLGALPVVDYPAGVLFASIARFVATKGLVRFTTSVQRTVVEIETDAELTLDEQAVIAGYCHDYDQERARAYPSV